MRIGLDLTCAATPRPSGTSLYATALARALAREAPGDEFLACYRLSALRRLGHAPEVGMPRRFFWDAFDPLLARRLDLFHGLESRAGRFGDLPQVVTLHDVVHLWAPGFFGARGADRRALQYREVAARAAAILTPSLFEKGKVVEHLGVPEGRVRAVPLAPSPSFAARTEPDPEVLARHGLSGRPYALFVGVVQPRKNVVRLMKAFARVPTDAALAIAGPVHPSAQPEFGEELSRLGGRVVCLGYVPNQDLPSLYAGARCMALVSEYESFGIPLVEAMACGCPVVTSDRAAMPEVAGFAGLLCDPGSVDSIEAALRAALLDPGRAAALREAGLKRAAEFSYARTARETLAIYREVAGGRAAPVTSGR